MRQPLEMQPTVTGKTTPPMLISNSLPPVPAKLVNKIQEGQFIEMAELLTDTLSSPEYIAEVNSQSHKQKPKEVTDILDWVQCFGVPWPSSPSKSPTGFQT